MLATCSWWKFRNKSRSRGTRNFSLNLLRCYDLYMSFLSSVLRDGYICELGSLIQLLCAYLPCGVRYYISIAIK